MATLNKTKKETQTVLKWGGISLVIIFLFFIGIRFLSFVKDSLTPPPPPQAAFGKLPKRVGNRDDPDNRRAVPNVVVVNGNGLVAFLVRFVGRQKFIHDS